MCDIIATGHHFTTLLTLAILRDYHGKPDFIAFRRMRPWMRVARHRNESPAAPTRLRPLRFPEMDHRVTLTYFNIRFHNLKSSPRHDFTGPLYAPVIPAKIAVDRP